MTVIECDFGKKPRETARRLRQGLSLDALHEHNIRENPLPYLERASERIFQLERALFEAAQALAEYQTEDAQHDELITVRKREYVQLLRCGDIVRQALQDNACGAEL